MKYQNVPKSISKCELCINKQHTPEEHKILVKREYMRNYMFKYNENKVAYRRGIHNGPENNL